MLGVLTNKLYLLSKPVTPDFLESCSNYGAKIVQKMQNAKNAECRIQNAECKIALRAPQ